MLSAITCLPSWWSEPSETVILDLSVIPFLRKDQALLSRHYELQGVRGDREYIQFESQILDPIQSILKGSF